MPYCISHTFTKYAYQIDKDFQNISLRRTKTDSKKTRTLRRGISPTGKTLRDPKRRTAERSQNSKKQGISALSEKTSHVSHSMRLCYTGAERDDETHRRPIQVTRSSSCSAHIGSTIARNMRRPSPEFAIYCTAPAGI